jgi:phage terminase large subunit-like protein
MHPATLYATQAVSGERIVGITERQACQRHLDDLKRQGTDKFPWIFDEEKADRVYRFFSQLQHIKGFYAGQSVELLPFQQFDLGVIFGWVHRETGYRRFQKTYMQVARKNGKTTMLAGVANYLMVADGEQSPEVYCAAVDKDQARIAYNIAKEMAERSLTSRLKIRDYKISHKSRGGQMVALSKDTSNKDGLNPSGAIIDEYHKHPTSEIYDLISSARGWRAQPLLVVITTAGYDTESPCHIEYDYAKSILERSIINERYFVMIRELDPEDDEKDPANWIKANPLRAATPEGIALLKEQANEAYGSGIPSKINTFRVKILNKWVQGDESNYLSADLLERWDQLAVTPAELDTMTEGMLCNVGADLAKRIDLTGVAHVWALSDGRIAVRAKGFMPEETLKIHQRTDKIPYHTWWKQNWLHLTEGEVTDYEEVYQYIQDETARNGNRMFFFCYDPYNAANMVNDMQKDGHNTIEVRQGVRTLSEPMKNLRILIKDRKIVHDGSPLLRWCLANVKEKVDVNENIQPSKKNLGSTRRIDLFAAVLNAFVHIEALREQIAIDNYIDSDEFGF